MKRYLLPTLLLASLTMAGEPAAVVLLGRGGER